MATRGRKKIEVSATELQAAITELESKQPDGKFPNRSQLWQALEQTEWAKSRNPRPLTGQVAYMLTKDGSFTIATPVGQRGKLPGSGPVPKADRKPKVISLSVIQEVKKRVPPKWHPVVDRAFKGSTKAKIKLGCLDCTNYLPNEVRHCELKGCIWWTVRPFKGKQKVEATEV